MKYDRTVIAYHGCDTTTAEEILAGGTFKKSQNNYDWLGEGIYFWEFGVDRAVQFAEFQKGMGKVKTPAVVGAILQLGECFDLMDTRFTRDLAKAYSAFKKVKALAKELLPKNKGKTPDKKLRHRDCAVLNFYLRRLPRAGFGTTRCGAPSWRVGPPSPGAASEARATSRSPSGIQLAWRGFSGPRW